MLAALASADGVTWISILVKTLAYAATLVAAGSVIVSLGLRALTEDGRRALRRTVIVAALAAALLSALRIPLRASFLMGGSLDGAFDPMMLRIVAESPLGASVLVRLIGLALILALLVPRKGARWLALAGALVTCTSFALRGHALGDPRWLFAPLVTVHITGLAFWLGALAPLARAARREVPTTAGALAQEFGTKALWIVAALVAAGAGTLALLGAATPGAFASPYGQGFLVKLGLFTAVLGHAALNKLRLTPALQEAVPGAARRLRTSIGMEAALILAILATTAAFTTVSAPPSVQASMTETQSQTRTMVAQLSGERVQEAGVAADTRAILCTRRGT